MRSFWQSLARKRGLYVPRPSCYLRAQGRPGRLRPVDVFDLCDQPVLDRQLPQEGLAALGHSPLLRLRPG
jgi:hypothetical protein